jgi:hypothetical protein
VTGPTNPTAAQASNPSPPTDGATQVIADTKAVEADVEKVAGQAAQEVLPDAEKWLADAKAEGHAIMDKIQQSVSLFDTKQFVTEARAWIEKFSAGPPSKQ